MTPLRAAIRTASAVTLLVACLLAGVAVAAALRLTDTSRVPPAPPFPSVMDGRPVEWVSDEEVRALVAGVRQGDVEWITLYGGSMDSPVPTCLRVTKPERIQMFLRGLGAALKRSDAPYLGQVAMPNGVIFGGVAGGQSSLTLCVRLPDGSLEERSTGFYADELEGSRLIMPSGTISPEFRDALRAAGIPDRKVRNLAESLLVDLGTRLRN